MIGIICQFDASGNVCPLGRKDSFMRCGEDGAWILAEKLEGVYRTAGKPSMIDQVHSVSWVTFYHITSSCRAENPLGAGNAVDIAVKSASGG